MNVPTKRPEKTPREWLRYAEGDLGVAERELAYDNVTNFWLESGP